MMNKTKFAVIGAGNGGHAFSAHLALLGFQVSLYDIEAKKVKDLKITGKIQVNGAVQGEATIHLITNHIGEAIRDVNVIMVVIPAVYHAGIVKKMVPYLQNNQVIVLNPGATGGALEIRNVLKQEKCSAEIIVAETNTLLYACRSSKAGEVNIGGVKDLVYVSALPSSKINEVVEKLNEAFPQYKPLPTTMFTSLENVNAMLHPAPMLLNTGRIETNQTFRFYLDGYTPSVVKIVENMDNERLSVGKAFGIKLPSLSDWYKFSYGVKGENLSEVIQNMKPYEDIQCSNTLNSRYLFEDIPTGLVPISELARAVNVKTPTIDSIIELGSTVLGRDFWAEGRSLSKLGLSGMNANQICEILFA